jgi:hypothetical protein
MQELMRIDKEVKHDIGMMRKVGGQGSINFFRKKWKNQLKAQRALAK